MGLKYWKQIIYRIVPKILVKGLIIDDIYKKTIYENITDSF